MANAFIICIVPGKAARPISETSPNFVAEVVQWEPDPQV